MNERVTLSDGKRVTREELDNMSDLEMVARSLCSRDPIVIELLTRIAKLNIIIRDKEEIIEGLVNGSLIGIPLSMGNPSQTDSLPPEVKGFLDNLFGFMPKEENGERATSEREKDNGRG